MDATSDLRINDDYGSFTARDAEGNYEIIIRTESHHHDEVATFEFTYEQAIQLVAHLANFIADNRKR